MPTVTVQMYAGRTHEQKAALAESVTTAISRSLGVDRRLVRITINEVEPENTAVGGVLNSSPVNE